MTHTTRAPPTILFTIRLWPEDVAPGEVEWRGELKNINLPQSYYFRDWPTLIQLITKMLESETSPPPQSTEKETR